MLCKIHHIKGFGLAALAFVVLWLSLLERRAAAEYWPLQINGRFFDRLEIARTPAAHRRGLMNRKEVPADGGMLFVFDREERRSFWMKNTLVPLDIVFLSASGHVVSCRTMKTERPRGWRESEADYERRLPLYPSGAPAQFVLELREGMIAELDIRVGQKIELYLDRKTLSKEASEGQATRARPRAGTFFEEKK